MEAIRYFATCARGLENVLAGELRALGAGGVATGRGGVHFAGDAALVYEANLWLRSAVRVLRPVMEHEVQSPEELYDAVYAVDWSRYMTVRHTLAVDCNVRDSQITHSKYAALKTKDAICDQFTKRAGSRPSVDVRDPMIKLNLHIHNNHAVLSLDSSGDSLHKRGYRTKLHKAALNEALAASLVLMSGWDGRRPLLDPFCGSGTLPIEAAWIAMKRPPALTRRRFGFQGWLHFDIQEFTAIRDRARREMRNRLDWPIIGSDHRKDVVTLARQNAKAAGCGHVLQFAVKDIAEFRPPDDAPGVIVCNPPYGERIGDEKQLRKVYRTFGDVLKQRFAGWRAFVLTGNASLARSINMKPDERIQLFNGRIPCQLLKFEI